MRTAGFKLAAPEPVVATIFPWTELQGCQAQQQGWQHDEGRKSRHGASEHTTHNSRYAVGILQLLYLSACLTHPRSRAPRGLLSWLDDCGWTIQPRRSAGWTICGWTVCCQRISWQHRRSIWLVQERHPYKGRLRAGIEHQRLENSSVLRKNSFISQDMRKGRTTWTLLRTKCGNPMMQSSPRLELINAWL